MASGNPFEEFLHQTPSSGANPFQQFLEQPDAKPEAEWGEVASAIGPTTVGGVKKSAGGLVQAAGDLLRAEGLAEYGAELARAGSEQIRSVQPTGDMSFWQRAALSGTSSVLQQLPALAASVVTMNPIPALVSAGAMAGGSTYSEAREAGLGGARSAGHALFDAGVEVVMERIPTKFLLKSLSGKTDATRLVLGLYAREVPTEVMTTAIQNANAKLSTRPDMGLEEYWDDIVDTVGTVMVSAPLTAGAGIGLNQVQPKPKSNDPSTPFSPPGAEETVFAGLESQLGDVGAVNDLLMSPSPDQEPTVVLDSAQQAELAQSVEAINPANITDQQLRDARRVLEEHQKQKANPSIPGAEEAWGQLSTAPTTPIEDAAELGASSRQAANAVNYVNPNTADRLDRPFLYGPEGYEGKTPRQIMPKPGTYTLGVPSDDRPADYLRAVHDSYEEWRQKYMPNATLVISNEQLWSNSAIGWHYNTGKDFHMIVPAVLRKPSRGLGKFNPNTQASAFYNATHEFGHALIVNRFFEDVEEAAVAQVREESRTGTISSIAALPAPQQAVVAEYNMLKAQVLDGTMTAQQFVTSWMGPAKAGRANFLKDLGVAPDAPAKQLVAALARRTADNSTIQKEASKTVLRKRAQEEVLSLDEYLAEQTARHAYQRKWDQSSPLGQFFQKALESLRRFFIERKKDKVIASGVAFDEWIEGISKSTRGDEIPILVANKKRAGSGKAPVAAKGKAVPAKGAKPKAKAKKVAHNVQSSTAQRTQKKFFTQIAFLEKAKTISAEEANNLRDLVNREEWEEFGEAFTRHASKNVRFEPDYDDAGKVSHAGGLEAQKEWKAKKFESRFFKAWFGDWQNSPDDASVVRVGVFEKRSDGTIALDRSAANPPLVSFVSLERLKKGENVFHASTVKGTHFAEAVFDEVTDPAVVPVVLNIRNPWIVEDTVTPAPPISDMQAQGYDGIVYPSELEGDMTFVVFRQDQIKVVDSRSPYSKESGVHMEPDYDQSQPEGVGAAKLVRGVKNFLDDQGPLRRALRRVINSTKVLQIQQLAHIHPRLVDLVWFVQTNTRYNQYKASRQVIADQILDSWRRFSSGQHKLIDRVLIDELEGRENWFELVEDKKRREGKDIVWYKYEMSQRARQELKKRGIDIETPEGKELADHVLRVKNSLLDFLNEDEKVLEKLLAYRLGHNVKVHYSAVLQLKKQIHSLRQAPFFPQGRFGNMMLIIRKKNPNAPGHEVVWREAFEDEGKWKAAGERARAKAAPDEIVETSYFTDHQYTLMSLPKEFMDLVTSELGLNDEQMEILQQILSPVRQEKLLSQYDQERLGVKGYTSDTRRSYANFSWHHANLQAKSLHRADFNLSIIGMKKLLREAERIGDIKEIQLLTRVTRAMEESRDYIMAPGNEAQTARAIVSISYLFANPKTALLNLYGLATTYFDLTSKYGVIEGEKRFIKAAWLAGSSMKLTDLNARKKGDYLPPDIQKALDRALEEGVLTQSYAYHLAGMANSSAFTRLPVYDHAGRWTQHGIDLGMYPFRLTELATRRISFVAAMQDKLGNKELSFDEAYDQAVAQVNKLQNDYSLGNRVPFMRAGTLGLGPIVPLATIFASFAQHMAWHGFGGYELGERRAKLLAVEEGKIGTEHRPVWYQWGHGYTARIWLLTMMLAGYEGLPGAENLIDLISVIWRKLGNAKPFRQELREFVKAVNGDPENWARGLGHNVLGFDLSRSIGFGRLFPGTDALAKAADESPEEMVGSMALDMAGPAGGVIKSMLAIKEKGFYEGGQRLPGGIGNLWTAYYWSENSLRGPEGGLITLDKDGKPRELTTTEIYGKALGFNPTIVSENREKFYAAHDQQMYWQARRKDVLDEFVKADWQRDREKYDEAREAVSKYNDSIPNEPNYRKLKITQADIQDRLKLSRKMRQREERGLPRARRYEGLHRDIRDSFDRPEEDQ